MLRPRAEGLHGLVIHAELLHDGDDVAADAVEDRLALFPQPVGAAVVVAEALIGLQEGLLRLLEALDFQSQLFGQLVRDHELPQESRCANSKLTSRLTRARQ